MSGNRSIFNDGVEVHMDHLSYESSSRISDLNAVVANATQPGVKSGLAVSVGSPATLINVGAGTGYVNNGAMVSYAGLSNISLASYTLNDVNYVALVYDEVYSRPESYEADGTTRNTRSTTTPRLVVLTTTQWNALPSTDSVPANNAIDRILLLARVTANGVGVALTSSSIETYVPHNMAISVAQPTGVTGVTVLSIDQNTPTGPNEGQLDYTASTHELAWAAPGELPTSPMVISGSGTYVLTSPGGHTLTVFITYSLLPSTNVTDLLTVYNLYTQPVPKFSAIDEHHRSLVGTGIPTLVNPHGLTLSDIDPNAGAAMQAHQLQQHSNGIMVGSSTSALGCSIETSTAPDYVEVAAFNAGDLAYVNGLSVGALSGSSSVLFSDGVADNALYTIYMTQTGTLGKRARATYAPAASVFITTSAQLVDCSNDIAASTLSVNWSTSNQLRFDGGAWRNMPSVDSKVRLYASNNVSWVDLFVKAGVSAPAALETLPIAFASPFDNVTNLELCTVCWDGSASGNLGYGFGTLPLGVLNQVTDKRTYGTLDVNKQSLGTASITRDSAKFVFESGIVPVSTQPQYLPNAYSDAQAVVDQFVCGTVGGGVVAVTGGSVFISGRHFSVPRAVVFMASSTTNRIYVNEAGLIRSSVATWNDITSDSVAIIRLWEVVVNGSGVETSRTDYRTYGASYRKNVPFGVPGLGRLGQLVLQPQQPTTAASTIAAVITGQAGNATYPDGGTAAAIVGGAGSSTTGSTGGTGASITGGEGGLGGSGANDGGIGASIRGGTGHFGGAGGVGLLVEGGTGGTGNGRAIEASAVDAEAIYVEVSGTATDAILTSGGGTKIPSTSDYKYDGYRTCERLIDASEFIKADATSLAALALMTAPETGEDDVKPIWVSGGSGTTVLVARVSVPMGAQISDAGFHFSNPAGATRTYVGKIQVFKPDATYGTLITTMHSESYSLSASTRGWSGVSAFTPFYLGDVASGSHVVVRVELPSAAGATFVCAKMTYTWVNVVSDSW